MPKKGQYLERHGNQWRVTVKVTAKARPILGKAHLKRPLHTDSLPRAEALKWSVIAELKAVISEAERQVEARARGGMDAIAAEALAWRAEIERGAEQPVSVDDEEHLINPALEVLDDRAEEIEKESGAEAARAFAEIAQGRATPIPSLLQSYFTEAELEPRTEADYRRAVERFAAWTQKQKLPGTIEQTTRKIAGRYISEALLAKAADGRTANKAVSALSSFWRWLIKRGHADANPWQGQSLPKRRSVTAEGERYKRPFTDKEIKTLLEGDPLKSAGGPRRVSPAWADLAAVMRIAAYSGMRIDEIACLRVDDCVEGAFNIRAAKTPAGIRKVPIHPELAVLVRNQVAGRSGREFLFPNIPTPPEGSRNERSMPWVKAFVRYRRGIGVDEREEGKRQARTDFHSFRRWFITKAEQASIPKETIASVVGHERAGVTFGVYSGGPSWEQRTACVEAVKLEP